MDKFTFSYLTAALECCPDAHGKPLAESFGAEDFREVDANIAREAILTFIGDNSTPGAVYARTVQPQPGEEGQTPGELFTRDFFYSRNGFSDGFLKRRTVPQDVREALHAAAVKAGRSEAITNPTASRVFLC